ncbi:MAG: Ig-like domain-containing protein, partial [Bacteroidia bacterium]
MKKDILYSKSIKVRKFLALLMMCIALFTKATFAQVTYETFKTGSAIIDMGAAVQTPGNALRPYGLVYDLINTHEVPIKWIINPTKAWQGTDFVHNGKTYRGGPFVVPKEYLTASVITKINTWVSSGVIVDYTVSDIVLPVSATLTSVPRWTLDAQNGSIAQGYLNRAGIPLSAYNWKAPNTLDCCDDLFVMPHADPCWNTHGHLLNWNLNCKGGIWAGCHAVSALENMFNPSNTAQQTNFLMEKNGPLNPTGCYTRNAAVLWTDHSAGTPVPPYLQNTALANEPFMQFLGRTDAATQNGSEQIFLPKFGWRSTTKVAVWDHDHPQVPSLSPGQAGQIIYGRGFGDPNRGWVMYEAGHRLDRADGPDNIAAQRIFFNWSLISMVDKNINLTITGASATMVGGGSYPLSATVSGGSGTYTYLWSAVDVNGNPIGTFSPSATSATPTYNAPTVLSNTQIFIKLKVTDNCGRKAFENKAVTLLPAPRPPVLGNDFGNITVACGGSGSSLTLNVLANDSDPDGDPLTITGVTGTNGTWTHNGTTVTYTPAPNFYGTATATYTVCAPTPFCATANITIGVGTPDVNGCYPGSIYDLVSTTNANAHTQNSVTNPTNAYVEDYDATDATTYAVLDANTDSLTLDFGSVIAYDVNKKISVTIASSNLTSVTGTLYTRLTNGGARTLLGTITNSNVDDETNLEFNIPSGGFRFLTIYRTSGTANLRVDAMVVNTYSCVSALPVAEKDFLKINEDNPGTINVLANDLIPGNQEVNIFIISGPKRGHASINPDNTISYINNTDISGYDTIVYRICTPENLCSQDSLIIEIVDDACSAGTYKQLTLSSPTTITISDNAVTEDNMIRRDRATTNYATGTTAELGKRGNKERRFIWRPLYPNFSTLVPSGATVTNATFKITQASSGDNVSLTFSAHEITQSWLESQATWNNRQTGTPWTTAGGTHLAGALDTKTQSMGIGVSSTFTVTSLVQKWVNNSSTNNGILIKQAGTVDKRHIIGTSENSNASYRPVLTVTFVTPSLTCVSIPNRAPMAMPNWDTTKSTTPKLIPVLANDTDPDGNTLSILSIIGPVSLGSATISGTNILFTPSGTSTGISKFRYVVSDGTTFDTAFVNVVIKNAAPIANKDTLMMNSGSSRTKNITSNDSDTDGPGFGNPVITVAPKNGIATTSGANLTYTPNSGFTGFDTLIYQICETSSVCGEDPLCDTAIVILFVQNQKPKAKNDTSEIYPCETVEIQVLANDNDPENGQLTVTILTPPNPAHGTATTNGTTITFVANPSFTGPKAEITYVICDNGYNILCDTAKVIILIPPAGNLPPVAVNDFDTAGVNYPVYYDILTNDSDPNNDNFEPLLSVTPPLLQPANGTVSLLPNGLLFYTPNYGFVGTDSMDYVICEVPNVNPGCSVTITPLCDTARFYITYQRGPNNTTPVANWDAASTLQNTPVNILVLNNDNWGTDGPGSLSPAIIKNTDHGVLTLNNNGTPGDPTDDYFVYTPNLNYYGKDTFIYNICDFDGECDTAIVYIDVIPVLSDLQVNKSASNLTPLVGSNVTFTITATNNGPSDNTNVIVNDAIPSGYTLVSVTPSTGTWSAPNWTIGNLANGASATLTVIATVNVSGTYANTATITGYQPDPNNTNNTSTSTPTPQPVTDLAVTKSASNMTPNVGSSITFTVTASNNGPSNATGVVVADAIPAGYTVSSVTPSTGTWSAPNWTIGNLANGGSATLTVVATVNASGPYTNTATITGNETDPNLANNSASVTPAPVPVTDLAVTKSASNMTPNVGSSITFTVTASNNGPSNATGVVVADAIPAGYTVSS